MSHQALGESRKNLDNYRDLYETLQAEDKVIDRDFRRKFQDIPGYQADALYKLFRRRPRFDKLLLSSPCPPPPTHYDLPPLPRGHLAATSSNVGL